jgi:hypothetical protein
MAEQISIETQLSIIDHKLDELMSTLGRMEERQIKTTSMVQEIDKEEQMQVQGSFGSTEPPK